MSMDGITGYIMPPCGQNICDYATKVAGTLRKASIISGILLGAFGLTTCGFTDNRYRDIGLLEFGMGLYIGKLLVLSNIVLIFGIFTEKVDFLCATLSINAVLIPTTPIWIVASLMTRGPGNPIGATAGPCALVAVFLQSAVVYGCLREMKGIYNAAEKSISQVGGYNTAADHKETLKGKSDAIPAVFSRVLDAKQADSPGV